MARASALGTLVAVVARKELTELARDGRLRWAGGLVTTLLVLAAVVGWMRHGEVEREVAQAAAADQQAWLAQGPRNPHSAAHFGQYAFRPSSPLSFLDGGVDSFVGNAIWMEAHSQDPARHRAAEDKTALARLGEPSAAFVLRTLVPLVLLLLAFGSVAGEREQGTWRQALAQGASPVALVLGKLVALATVIGLPLLLAALVGGLGLVGSGAGATLPGSFARYLALVAGTLLFLLGFLGLSLAVSAWARSRRVALLALFGVWITTTAILPRLLGDLAERQRPVPPPTLFWKLIADDQSQGIDGHNPADERTRELEKRVMAEYGVTRIEDLPVNFDAIAMQAGEDYSNQVFDRRWGEVWDTYQRQERFQAAWSPLVPVVALRGLSMAMAGTDLAHQRHFATAAEGHRRVINRQLNAHMRDFAGKEAFAWRADPAFWAEVPRFSYTPPGFGDALAGRLPELGALLAWAFLGPFLATFAARRAAAL